MDVERYVPRYAVRLYMAWDACRDDSPDAIEGPLRNPPPLLQLRIHAIVVRKKRVIVFDIRIFYASYNYDSSLILSLSIITSCNVCLRHAGAQGSAFAAPSHRSAVSSSSRHVGTTHRTQLKLLRNPPPLLQLRHHATKETCVVSSDNLPPAHASVWQKLGDIKVCV